jgi:acyl-CoA thioesterase-1
MRFCLLLLALFSAFSGSAQMRVINDGFPGRNTAELDAQLDGALHKFKPTYVVLFAGGNDALNEKKFLPAEQTCAHLEAMVQRIEKTGANVVMVTMHDPDIIRLMKRHDPVIYTGIPPLKRLAMVNVCIRETAKRDHAPLVPFHEVLQKEGGANEELSTDGVHLTAKGYGMLAAAVRAKLPQHLPVNTTILCFGDSLTYGIGVRPLNDASETGQTYPAQLRALLK